MKDDQDKEIRRVEGEQDTPEAGKTVRPTLIRIF